MKYNWLIKNHQHKSTLSRGELLFAPTDILYSIASSPPRRLKSAATPAHRRILL
jgi:hypothetical protein